MKKTLIFVILLIFICACSSQKALTKTAFKCPKFPEDFRASFFYTAELTYQEITIHNTELVYTYFEDTEGKCEMWMRQSPCWTMDDLITKKSKLSQDEVNDLFDLINQTNFMDIPGLIGKAEEEGRRYYPFRLTVAIGDRKKTVVYQDYLKASPMPEAFKKVKDKLIELAGKKN